MFFKGIFIKFKLLQIVFKYWFSDLLYIFSDKSEINSEMIINIGILNNESGQKSSVNIIKFLSLLEIKKYQVA